MDNHPCYNANCRQLYGRLHIPVAPKCNIKCNYCNRKYDCLNESRPGVTSQILTPLSAIHYLLSKKEYILKSISVLGIAGPGDPMATPVTTIKTLREVRHLFPDKILCISTNGLNLAPYVNDLVAINVSHITITINAVNPIIGSKIYKWARYRRRTLYGIDAAKLLLENQLEALRNLREKGVNVKVNSVVIPNVNDNHMSDIAKEIACYDVDVHNCIPLIPIKGTPFEDFSTLTNERIRTIREDASKWVRQIAHCNRCRADACGLLK